MMGSSSKWTLALTVLMASLMSYCGAAASSLEDPVKIATRSGCVTVVVENWTRPLCKEMDFIYIDLNPDTSNFEFTVYSGFHSVDLVGVEPKTAQPNFGQSYSLPLSTIKKAGNPRLIIETNSCLYPENNPDSPIGPCPPPRYTGPEVPNPYHMALPFQQQSLMIPPADGYDDFNLFDDTSSWF